MDPIYLTDSIVLLGDRMVHGEDQKPLKKNNWHHILKEYGWTKMPKRWISILKRCSEIKEKNSQYGLLDCEHDGDCFYSCIGNALTERDGYERIYDSGDIRKMISESITESSYETIIGYYRAMKNAGDFQGSWDPNEVQNLGEFRDILLTSGHTYWGDYVILSLLVERLNVNVLVLTSDEFTNEYSVYRTGLDYVKERDTICLLHVDREHFKLVGHFNGHRMVSYFHGTVPSELLRIHNYGD